MQVKSATKHSADDASTTGPQGGGAAACLNSAGSLCATRGRQPGVQPNERRAAASVARKRPEFLKPRRTHLIVREVLRVSTRLFPRGGRHARCKERAGAARRQGEPAPSPAQAPQAAKAPPPAPPTLFSRGHAHAQATPPASPAPRSELLPLPAAVPVRAPPCGGAPAVLAGGEERHLCALQLAAPGAPACAAPCAAAAAHVPSRVKPCFFSFLPSAVA